MLCQNESASDTRRASGVYSVPTRRYKNELNVAAKMFTIYFTKVRREGTIMNRAHRERALAGIGNTKHGQAPFPGLTSFVRIPADLNTNSGDVNTHSGAHRLVFCNS